MHRRKNFPSVQNKIFRFFGKDFILRSRKFVSPAESLRNPLPWNWVPFCFSEATLTEHSLRPLQRFSPLLLPFQAFRWRRKWAEILPLRGSLLSGQRFFPLFRFLLLRSFLNPPEFFKTKISYKTKTRA